MRVRIDAPEGHLLVPAHAAAEAGARFIDKDVVADIEQDVVVVDDLVGCALIMLTGGSDHAARAEGAHMKPHRSAAWAVIVQKGPGRLGRHPF
jgi:hypothetical protein